MSNETTTADGGVRKKGKLGQRIAYACGNLGQSAFYNAMSTYFIVYVTGCLFSGVDKALAAKLIGVITSLVGLSVSPRSSSTRCWATSSTTPTPSGDASAHGSSSAA